MANNTTSINSRKPIRDWKSKRREKADMFENDYTITGKHATYLKYLAEKNADSATGTTTARVFERYIDVYMNAAIWGLLYNRTANKDTTSNDRARIYADAFVNERENCTFLYRLIMLLDKSAKLTPTERVDRAFRYDTQPEKADEVKKNLDLFNSYVLGGLEILYEKITEGCVTRSDYMQRIFEIMNDFQDEVNGISVDDEIRNLLL